MKNIFLLPHYFLKAGIIAVLIGAALGLTHLLDMNLSIFNANVDSAADGFSRLLGRTTYQGVLGLTIFLMGLYFVGFSKRKIDDEFLDFIRYQSLILSLIIQTLVLIVSSWFVEGLAYVNVMFINLFSFLLIYNLTFFIMMTINRLKSAK